MLKLVPVIVEPSREVGGSGLDGSRRSPFSYHIPTPTNCSLAHHNGHNQPQYSPLTQCVWTFFWLAMLLFVGYPVGVLSGQLYVLISPFSALACCKPLCLLLSVLEEGLHLPLACTNNMATAKPLVII